VETSLVAHRVVGRVAFDEHGAESVEGERRGDRQCDVGGATPRDCVDDQHEARVVAIGGRLDVRSDVGQCGVLGERSRPCQRRGVVGAEVDRSEHLDAEQLLGVAGAEQPRREPAGDERDEHADQATEHEPGHREDPAGAGRHRRRRRRPLDDLGRDDEGRPDLELRLSRLEIEELADHQLTLGEQLGCHLLDRRHGGRQLGRRGALEERLHRNGDRGVDVGELDPELVELDGDVFDLGRSGGVDLLGEELEVRLGVAGGDGLGTLGRVGAHHERHDVGLGVVCDRRELHTARRDVVQPRRDALRECGRAEDLDLAEHVALVGAGQADLRSDVSRRREDHDRSGLELRRHVAATEETGDRPEHGTDHDDPSVPTHCVECECEFHVPVSLPGGGCPVRGRAIVAVWAAGTDDAPVRTLPECHPNADRRRRTLDPLRYRDEVPGGSTTIPAEPRTFTSRTSRPLLVGGLPLDRVSAHLYLALYLVTAFEPFVLVRHIPGSVIWGLLPLIGVAALITAPAERLATVRLDLALVAVATWTAASLAWSTSFPIGWYTVRTEVPTIVLVSLVVGTMRPREVIDHLVVLMGGIVAWSIALSIVWPTARTAVIGVPPNLDVILGWRGSFLHKNLLGIFSVLGLGTVLCFPSIRGRAPLAVVFVVAAVGTRSATAGVGLVTTLILWSWLTWIGRIEHAASRAIAKVGSVVMLALSILASVVTVPLFVQLYGKDLTLTGRTDIWEASWRMIARSPWVGHGVGSIWHDRFNPLTTQLRREIDFDAAHAHSGALDVLLATGAIGLALVVVFVITLVRLATKALRDRATATYGRWVLVSLAAVVVMSGSEPLFEPPALGFLAIVGAVAARARSEARFVGVATPPAFPAESPT
jgi:O-antigen ligase